MASSIDAAIEEEERLIRLYTAELAILDKQEEQKIADDSIQNLQLPPTTDAETTNNDDDPLDWILQQTPDESVSSLLSSLEIHESEGLQEDLHRLQPAIRNFCFTSVDRNAGPSSAISYQFQGYFVTDPSVKANILIDFQFDEKQKNDARILRMECKLKDENLSWLEQEARLRGEESNNLAAWIERVSNYLNFDLRRKRCISEWQEQDSVQASHSNGKTVLEIPLKRRKSADDENSDDDDDNESQVFVSVIWGWKWKDGRDVLRLTQASAELGLRQQELDNLVQTCDSCEKAIRMIMPQRPCETSEDLASSQRSCASLLQDPLDDADDEASSDEGENSEQDINGTSPPVSPGRGPLSEYELMRKERIKRNEQYLAQLGLKELTKNRIPGRGRRKGRKRKKWTMSPSKLRVSSRVRTKPKPLADEQLLERLNKPQPRAVTRIVSRSQPMSGIEEERLTEDGCVLATSTPVRKGDGTFARPPGRGPSGYIWDSMRGIWIPEDANSRGDLEQRGHPGKTLESSTLSTLNIARPSRPLVPMQVDTGVNDVGRNSLQERMTEDGCLLPTSSPVQNEDGSFVRPRGRGPAGYDWDPMRGVWIPFTDSSVDPERQARYDGDNSDSAPLPILDRAVKPRRLPDPEQDAGKDLDPFQERMTEDGCVLPVSTPVQKEDGTYTRPKGRGLSGYSWDSIRGLWAPDSHASVDDRVQIIRSSQSSVREITFLSSAEMTKSSMSSNQGQVVTKDPHRAPLEERITEDGCVIPTSTPVRKEDGTFARPPGRGPSGYIWDSRRGIWIPEDANSRGDLEQRGDPGKTSEASTLSTLNMARPSWLLDPMQVDTGVNNVGRNSLQKRMTEDGCLLPTSSPVQNDDGSFVRPRGRGPAGYDWDPMRGVWIPFTDSSSDPERQARYDGDSSASAPLSILERAVKPRRLPDPEQDAGKDLDLDPFQERMTEDGCVLPVSTPVQKEDGTYTRPKGRGLSGYSWDSIRGLWAPDSHASVDDRVQIIRSSQSSVREITLLSSAEMTKSSMSSNQGQVVTKDPHRAPLEERITEDGCVILTSTPVLKENGTYARPKGRGPSGCSWSSIKGVWVPDAHLSNQAEIQVRSSQSSMKRVTFLSSAETIKSSMPSDQSQVDTKDPQRAPLEERMTEDGCVIPISTPVLKEDGTYARPKGRGPSGYSWGSIKGVWVPDAPSSDHAKTQELSFSHGRMKGVTSFSSAKTTDLSILSDADHGASIDPDRAPLEERMREDGCLLPTSSPVKNDVDRLPPGQRTTEDGSILPLSDPVQKEDETFVRPQGRGPSGYSWDSQRGVWVPVEESVDENLVAHTDSNLKLSANVDKNELLSRLNSGPLNDEEYHLPPKVPHLREDGTYARPRGKTPLGYSWDEVEGIWVRTQEENSCQKSVSHPERPLSSRVRSKPAFFADEQLVGIVGSQDRDFLPLLKGSLDDNDHCARSQEKGREGVGSPDGSKPNSIMQGDNRKEMFGSFPTVLSDNRKRHPTESAFFDNSESAGLSAPGNRGLHSYSGNQSSTVGYFNIEDDGSSTEVSGPPQESSEISSSPESLRLASSSPAQQWSWITKENVQQVKSADQPLKRKRGRPKGSKNKRTHFST